MIYYIAQAFGIFATLCCFAMPLFKKKWQMLLITIGGNLFFILNLLFLGLYETGNLFTNATAMLVNLVSLAQVLISVIAAHVIGSLIVKTFGIYAYYNISYGLMLLYRLTTYTVIAAIESSAICLILKHKAFKKYTRYQNELQ